MAAMAGDVEDFDVEIDLPRFLNSVLEKAEYIWQRNVERRIVEQHIVVIDQTVSLLRSLRDSRSIIDTADKEMLSDLSSAFNDVFCAWKPNYFQVLKIYIAPNYLEHSLLAFSIFEIPLQYPA